MANKRDHPKIGRKIQVVEYVDSPGIQWEYNGNTMGIQWEYSGNTVGIQWEYNGNTMVYDKCKSS